MRKWLVLAACMVFLLAGVAQAAVLNTTSLTGTSVAITGEGSPLGGPYQNVTLDGVLLEQLYCIDFDEEVYYESYGQTLVNRAGSIYNQSVSSAAYKVAWILTNYGTNTPNTDQARAVAASIWYITDGKTLNTSVYGPTNGTRLFYDSIIDDFEGASPTYNETLAKTYVGNFYWITPAKTADNPHFYQALVAKAPPVPIPGAVWLMGSGLAGLVGVARFRRKRTAA